MTDSEFSAGYWVEHNMFGDVVVFPIALYGSYCIRDPVTSKIANNPIAIPAGGLFFPLVNVETIGFQATKGHSKQSMFDPSNGVFGAPTVLYHSGRMIGYVSECQRHH
jgi:hypothetical protein